MLLLPGSGYELFLGRACGRVGNGALTILLASLDPEGRPANKSPLSKTTLSAPGVMGGGWYFSLSSDDDGTGGGAGCVASVGGGGERLCLSLLLLVVVVLELLLVVEDREVDEGEEDRGGESSMLAERTIGSAVGAIGGVIFCGSIG